MARGGYKRKYQYGGFRTPKLSQSMQNRMMVAMNCVENKYKDMPITNTWVTSGTPAWNAATTSTLVSAYASDTNQGFTRSIISCFEVQQGDNHKERVGRKIYVKSIMVTGSLWQYDYGTPPGAEESFGAKFRLIVAQVRNRSALVDGQYATTQFKDVLRLTDDSGQFVHIYDAPRNMEKIANYKILKDKKFIVKYPQLQNGATTVFNYAGRPINFVLRFKKPLEICYAQDNTTGKLVGIMDTDLDILVGTQGLTNRFYLELRGRMKWTD